MTGSRIVFLEGTCHPNKTALQFYVPADAATEPLFPFSARDQYRGLTVSGTDALLVWPTGDSPTFPVEIPAPPPESLPWPLEDTTAGLSNER